MTPEKAYELARLIVADISVNGAGETGDRLVITATGPPIRDLGGWGLLPLVDRIARMLEEHG